MNQLLDFVPPQPEPPLNPTIEKTRPLSRELVVLGWVSFFNDVSSEMIRPWRGHHDRA